uniref:Uncharacterized protein n=1 Tax=Oryza punctata TaxID=4537 RepID=A0A0E0JXA0_ORYPU
MEAAGAARLRVRLVAILVVVSLLMSPPFLPPCVLAAGSSGGGNSGELVLEAGREMKHEGHLVIDPRKLTRPRRVLNGGGPNYDPIHNGPFSPGRSKK